MPEWGLLPLVILATVATVIASQATLTGAMSLTRQAIQLGLLPRMEIRHTWRPRPARFICRRSMVICYAPFCCCALFLRKIRCVGVAYGIAVNGTMVVTSILAFIALPKILNKTYAFSAFVILPFLMIELVFLGSNLMKFFDGGLVPVFFAIYIIIMIVTWVQGSRYLHKHSTRKSISMVDLIEKLDRTPPHVVSGTAIFLTSDSRNAPEALTQNLKHNQVIHEKNIILTVAVAEVPNVPESQRLISRGVYRHASCARSSASATWKHRMC